MAAKSDLQERLELLEQENQRLRAELQRMHEGMRCSGLTMGPSLVPARARPGGTIIGLEELILQVNDDLSIGYVNSPMARLLDIADRRAVLGRQLATIDQGVLGNGVLRSVVDSARATGETVIIERVCPDLPAERLPDAGAPRPSCDPVLRFVANTVKGRVELVVQDITRLRWLESTFARYVAPEVIDQMLARPQASYLTMEQRRISVLFADLRGFTSLTQQLPAATLQEMINQFLTEMVASIMKFGGMVDKFIGDEVMAIFGAPVAAADHALRALLAALDMVERHRHLAESWRRAGRPAAGVGIGVTTGEAFVGNLGTASRLDYTAIGHTVNLAARLCAAAAAGEILTGRETYQAVAEDMKTTTVGELPRFKFSPRGKQNFKNVAEPVSVLAVSTA